MNKIQELDAKIEELKKEREIALLELEIKKIKKTVVEEDVVKKVVKEEWYYQGVPLPIINYPKYIVTC